MNKYRYKPMNWGIKPRVPLGVPPLQDNWENWKLRLSAFFRWTVARADGRTVSKKIGGRSDGPGLKKQKTGKKWDSVLSPTGTLADPPPIFFLGVLDTYCSRVVFTSLLPVVPYPHPSKIPPFRLHQTSCSSLYTNHQMLFFIRLTNFKQIVADKTFLSASFLSPPHSQIHCRLCPAITSEHCQTNQKCSQPLPLHPKPCRNAWCSQLFWESSRSHWHLLLRHCQLRTFKCLMKGLWSIALSQTGWNWICSKTTRPLSRKRWSLTLIELYWLISNFIVIVID